MPSRTPSPNSGSGDGGGNDTTLHAVGDPLHGPGTTTPGTNASTVLVNNTATSLSHPGESGGAGMPGGVIALLLCLLLVGVAVLCIIFYLKRTGKLYKLIPFKPLINSRRGSWSHSDRATLHLAGGEGYEDPTGGAGPEEGGDRQGLEVLDTRRLNHRVEATMFTIEDQGMDAVDMGDGGSRGSANDEYFYDEAFGQPVFEDEVTNASMRELYLPSVEAEDDEDELDVDALVGRIIGDKARTASKT